MPTRSEKPGGLLLAIGKGGEEEPDEGDDMGAAKKRAAKDMMAAMKSGDAGAFSAALERHYEACGMGGSEADEEY